MFVWFKVPIHTSYVFGHSLSPAIIVSTQKCRCPQHSIVLKLRIRVKGATNTIVHQRGPRAVESGRLRPLRRKKKIPFFRKIKFYESWRLRRKGYMSRGTPIFFWEDKTCLVLKLHGMRHGAGTPPSRPNRPFPPWPHENPKKKSKKGVFLHALTAGLYFTIFWGNFIIVDFSRVVPCAGPQNLGAPTTKVCFPPIIDFRIFWHLLTKWQAPGNRQNMLF